MCKKRKCFQTLIFLAHFMVAANLKDEACFNTQLKCAVNKPRAIMCPILFDKIKTETVTGIECQSWRVQQPHTHNIVDNSLFPNKCLDPEPKSPTGPWCFTIDPNIERQQCFPNCDGTGLQYPIEVDAEEEVLPITEAQNLDQTTKSQEIENITPKIEIEETQNIQITDQNNRSTGSMRNFNDTTASITVQTHRSVNGAIDLSTMNSSEECLRCDKLDKLVKSIDLSNFNISQLSEEEKIILDDELTSVGVLNTTSEQSTMLKLSSAGIAVMSNLKAQNNLTDQELEHLLNPRERFLVKCMYGSEACDIANEFTTVEQPSYGVCFTYNHDFAAKNETGYSTFVNKGLFLVLDTDAEQYVPTTVSGGVKILMHRKQSYPFIDAYGIFLPVGVDARMQIDLTETHRLSVSGAPCLDKPLNDLNLYNEIIYSYEGCMRSLLQINSVTRFQCYNPLFPHGSTLNSTAVCDGTEMGHNESTNNMLDEDLCSKACTSINYRIQTSFSASVISKHKSLHSFEKESAVMLNVFLQSAVTLVYTESLAITREDIFTTFCQMIGLFFGISAIELAALIVGATQLIVAKIAALLSLANHFGNVSSKWQKLGNHARIAKRYAAIFSRRITRRITKLQTQTIEPSNKN